MELSSTWQLSVPPSARMMHLWPTADLQELARQRRIDKPEAEIEDFDAWLPQVTPNWTWNWPHQLFIYDALERVTNGETKRLMIFMPPRHTKTETVTVRYSAYRLEQDPTMNIILGSYNQHLANRFS